MTRLERSTGSRRLGWVSLVGVLVIPIMLAAAFLAATWGSSSRWHQVQAAIVNNDQPVRIGGQIVPLGRQLASGLAKGGSGPGQAESGTGHQNFDWVTSDAGDAADGLAAGRYAAVVTIPTDFSRAATSYSENAGDKAEQATLNVQTSKVSGITDSAIAQAISSAAVSALNTQLTRHYLDNLYLGFNQAQAGIQKSADGAGKLADGTDRLSTGIGRSADGAGKFAAGLTSLSKGTTKLAGGISRTATGTRRLATGIDGLHNGIKQTDAGIGQIDTGVGTLDTSMSKYAAGAATYAQGVKQYTRGVSRLTGSVGSYADGVSSYIDGVDQYAGGVDRFAAGVGPAADAAQAAVTAPATLAQGCTSAGFAPDSSECQIFQAGMRAGAGGVAAGVKTGLVGTPSAPGPALTIQAGSQQLISHSTTLKQASTGLSGATGKLGDAGDRLATGADSLTSGARQLADGIAGVHQGIGRLAAGTGKLENGAAQLGTGASKLSDGMGQLATAGDQLATGSGQSATGAWQLSSGLSTLNDGATRLATGSRGLATGLQKAADQLPTYSRSDRHQLAKVASAPVTSDRPVGLFANQTSATLLMALALWVGGLVTYLVVRAVPSDAFGSQRSSARLALDGVAPGVIIGAIQAVALSVLIGVLLDLSAGRILALLGFGVFAAVTFAVLNQALVAWLGGLGRFISLAVVVAAAAGSLTNAVPQLFGVIRPYLPITPALDGVRMIVTNGPTAGGQVAVLITWLVVGGVTSVLAVARCRVAPAPAPAISRQVPAAG